MKILITGIKGNLASSLALCLSKTHTVYGLSDVFTTMQGVRRVFISDEMNNLPEMDVVIHVAGKSEDTHDLTRSLEYFEKNAGLTRKTFQWFLRTNTKTFIYFSSVRAAASTVNGDPLTEEMEPTPFGPMGESKLLAEKYILEAVAPGKKVYVVRPAVIYGRSILRNRMLRKMTNATMKDWIFPWGKFSCNRSFTSLDNLCFVLNQMLALDIPGGVYNVADDDYLSLTELELLVCETVGKKPRIYRINKNILHLIAWIGTKFHWDYNEFEYEKLSSDFVVNNTKIKKALGIEQMPLSTVDGLREAIKELARI